jgi:hypothetical protein
MNLYSAYDYLAFVVPGGVVIFAIIASTQGLPTSDIGVGILVVGLGGSFLVGHVLAAIASFLEPLAWGHRPGSRVEPLWGQDGPNGYGPELDNLASDLTERYGEGHDLRRLYQLAHTEIQYAGKDERLRLLNSQLGFYRNAAVAFLVAAIAQLIVYVRGTPKIDTWPWIGLYLMFAILFIFRYRRFWRQFADNVIRGFRVLRRPAS